MECDRYEERDKLIGSVVIGIEVVGIEEFHRRLEEEEDGGILTVLGLHRGQREREKKGLIRVAKKFMVAATWGKQP